MARAETWFCPHCAVEGADWSQAVSHTLKCARLHEAEEERDRMWTALQATLTLKNSDEESSMPRLRGRGLRLHDGG